MSKQLNKAVEFEEYIQENDEQKYMLRLFVTGITPKSTRAVQNVKRICETYLSNNYSLEVIDIYQQPHLAEEEQIIAAPTLIKKTPLPIKRLIGDMSNVQKVLSGLNLGHKYDGQQF